MSASHRPALFSSEGHIPSLVWHYWHNVYFCIRIASIKQKLGLYSEAMELYNSILLQSADYVPALQGTHFRRTVSCSIYRHYLSTFYSVNYISLHFYYASANIVWPKALCFWAVRVFVCIFCILCWCAIKQLLTQCLYVRLYVHPCVPNIVNRISWKYWTYCHQTCCILGQEWTLQVLRSKGQSSSSQWGPTCWKMHFLALLTRYLNQFWFCCILLFLSYELTWDRQTGKTPTVVYRTST